MVMKVLPTPIVFLKLLVNQTSWFPLAIFLWVGGKAELYLIKSPLLESF